jgi:hypothetical protein
VVGFDLEEIKWEQADFASQKAFLLHTIDMAATRYRWDELCYDPPLAETYLRDYREIVDRFDLPTDSGPRTGLGRCPVTRRPCAPYTWSTARTMDAAVSASTAELTLRTSSAVTTNVRRVGPSYCATMPLGVTRPLRVALRSASTPTELFVLLGYPELAARLPPALTLRQLMDAASHLAALRRHPYVSPDHVALAGAHEIGDGQMVDSLARHLDGITVSTRRWWRPLGRRSALRSRGQRLLDDQQRAAVEREDWQPGER